MRAPRGATDRRIVLIHINKETFLISAQVLSISAWVRVGWHKNVKLVSPSLFAVGSLSGGISVVP